MKNCVRKVARAGVLLVLGVALTGCGKDKVAKHAESEMEEVAQRMNETLKEYPLSAFPTDAAAFQKWADGALLPAADRYGLRYEVALNHQYGNFGISVSGLSEESCSALEDMMPKTGPRKEGDAYVLSGSSGCHQLVRPMHGPDGPHFYLGFCLPAAKMQCPQPLGLTRSGF
jgi:hypothetical protein